MGQNFICRYGPDHPLAVFKGHQDEVTAIKWNLSGKLQASCSDDTTAKLWSISSEEPVHDFLEHAKEINTERWCPSTQKTLMLATASHDTTVKLWNGQTGQCLNTLARHKEALNGIAFSQDGNYLVSGSYEKYLRIWSVKDGSLIRTYQGNSVMYDVSWNANDNIAACFGDGTVVVIDPTTSRNMPCLVLEMELG